MSLDCPKITRGLADSSKTEYKIRHERKAERVEEKKKEERTREREKKNEKKKVGINQSINILFYVCSHRGDIKQNKNKTKNI